MDSNSITCPHCNKIFTLTKAITSQIENQLKEDNNKVINLLKK